MKRSLPVPRRRAFDVRVYGGEVRFERGALVLAGKLPDSGISPGVVLRVEHTMGPLRHLYVPHLTPEPGQVAGDFVFRSPAVIWADRKVAVAFVPDVEDVAGADGYRVWLDYDHPRRRLEIGAGAYRVEGHTFFRREPLDCRGQRVRLRVHVLVGTHAADLRDPYRMVAAWIWGRWGRPALERGTVLGGPVSRYLEHVTRWAFDDEVWGKEVWQEVSSDGGGRGAPVFIVDVTRHLRVPPAERRWREPRSIWNQAWFSTQRCANGLLRHARHTRRADLEARARQMTNLSLSAPCAGGLFPSVLRCPEPEGWSAARWGNSDRRPEAASSDACHLVDAAFTCRMLLEWSALTRDVRALAYVVPFADRLLELQRPTGAFPGWVEQDGTVIEALAESAESAVSVSLLYDLTDCLRTDRYREAARRGAAFLENVVEDARWEDFETYYSCAPWGALDQLGRRVRRNGVYKHNTLSIAWCAEALLSAWRAVGDPRHLALARRALGELSLYQAVYDPPFLTAPALGGFGVMNGDCEWNDARQSLFAPIYLDAHEATGDAELFERGVAALRASFTMMYCPENARLAAAYERRYPLFGPESYGFMMENQGHAGSDEIGTFTIYTWGNGSALEAAAKARDLYPDAYRWAFPEG